MTSRTRARLAALLTAAAALTMAACTAPGQHPGAPKPSSTATTTAPALTRAAWPGQLTGAAVAPQLTFADGVALVPVKSALTAWSEADVDAAWKQARDILDRLGANPALVDPGKTITSGDFAAAAGASLSESAARALETISAAALAGERDAAETLRPLAFWYGEQEANASTDLRLAKRPYGPYRITDARATGLKVGDRSAIAFQVATELHLLMVDESGAGNRVFLNRTVQLAMVPGPAGGPAWLLDGWTGQWQLTKPAGQALPQPAPDTTNFHPGAFDPQADPNPSGSPSTEVP